MVMYCTMYVFISIKWKQEKHNFHVNFMRTVWMCVYQTFSRVLFLFPSSVWNFILYGLALISVWCNISMMIYSMRFFFSHTLRKMFPCFSVTVGIRMSVFFFIWNAVVSRVFYSVFLLAISLIYTICCNTKKKPNRNEIHFSGLFFFQGDVNSTETRERERKKNVERWKNKPNTIRQFYSSMQR